MAGRSNGLVAAIVAVCGLGAGVGLFLAAGKGTPAREEAGVAPAGLAGVASELDAQLRAASAGAQSRATTLGDLPRLQSAVGTDAATVADLTLEELQFKGKDRETIEIGQVMKADGTTTSLRKIPADATLSAPLAKPGPHVMVVGDTLVVTEVVNVVPSDKARAEEVTGAIAVSLVLDVKPVVAKLDELGVGARIELDGKSVIAGKTAVAAGARTASAPVGGDLGKSLAVIAEVKSTTVPGKAPSTPLRAAGGGAALLGLILAAVLWKRGGGQPAVAAAVQPGTGAGTGTGTGTGTGFAAGTTGGFAGTGTGGPGRPGTQDQVGRYAISQPLGEGGMAKVFLARVLGEAGFEKQVALKVMHRELARDEKAVSHFLDEARLASRLTHPNIVQISDLGKVDEDYFIAMEYVDGADLDRLLRGAKARGVPVPPKVGLTIVRKVCDGLHAAHTATGANGEPLELVHRDVKCENVMLSRAGAVKIADFGIAKAAVQSHKTEIGQVKGTAAFMAPEHRTGQAIDRRADLYGVGAIAYMVLTGADINLDLATLAHLGRDGWPHLAPPSQIRPELPPELDAVIFKALAFAKEDRYADCAVFEEALEAIAAKYGLSASDKVIAQWVEGELGGAAAQASWAG